jgi:hypothetical protein
MGTGSGTGSTTDAPSIYQPFQPGEAADGQQVPGQIGAGGTIERQQLPGEPLAADGTLRRPLADVLPDYREQAGVALDQQPLPPHLKDYIRDYFAGLSP